MAVPVPCVDTVCVCVCMCVSADGNKKSPLMQTGIYSLDDTEHQAGEADATLPQSHKAT